MYRSFAIGFGITLILASNTWSQQPKEIAKDAADWWILGQDTLVIQNAQGLLLYDKASGNLREIDAKTEKLLKESKTSREEIEKKKPESPRASYPLSDGGQVIEKDYKLLLLRDGKEKDLFEQPCRVWTHPDNAAKPRRLVVSRLTDTNGDGKISRLDDDWVEIWLLDLKTLDLHRLADAKSENIERDWMGEGRYWVFNRIVDNCGQLHIYDARTGNVSVFKPSGNNDYVMPMDLIGKKLFCVETRMLAASPGTIPVSDLMIRDIGDPTSPGKKVLSGQCIEARRLGENMVVSVLQDAKMNTRRLLLCPLDGEKPERPARTPASHSTN